MPDEIFTSLDISIHSQLHWMWKERKKRKVVKRNRNGVKSGKRTLQCCSRTNSCSRRIQDGRRRKSDDVAYLAQQAMPWFYSYPPHPLHVRIRRSIRTPPSSPCFPFFNRHLHIILRDWKWITMFLPCPPPLLLMCHCVAGRNIILFINKSRHKRFMSRWLSLERSGSREMS